jgi:predicted ArsR family transcriptional regulator
MTDDEFAVQVAGVSALADPVRRALYRFVVDAGDVVSRDQVAAGAGVARHTAKFHLDRLVDDGLLDIEFRRLSGRRGPGAGRPAKLYRRSEREFAVALPPRHYDVAGRILAAGVDRATAEDRPVREAVRAAARDEGRRLGHSSGRRELLQVLTELGYEPRREGERVVLANCPFHALAAEHTDLVCGVNADMLTALIDERSADPVRAELEPAPGRCCVVLEPEV